MPSFVSLLQNRAEPGRRGSISQGAQTTEDQRRFFCQEHQPTNQPNQPHHPTIHLIHHSTHSFQDVANLLPRYLIQDLNHFWSFMGSQATCFFHENGMCQGNHLYLPPGRQLWGIHYQKFLSFNEVTFRLLFKIISQLPQPTCSWKWHPDTCQLGNPTKNYYLMVPLVKD